MATLQELRDFVRTHADADSTDAPDSSLDVYARIAYNDIHTRTSFPHLQVTYTFTTVAGQQDYPFTGIGGLDKVTSIIDTTNLGRRLIYMSESDADLAFGAPIGATSEVANAYTVVNGVIKLYPKPSVTGKLYTVRGLRTPNVWPNGAGSVPDLPAVLHDAIAWYMLSSYFMSQEDLQMAGMYLREYEAMVDKFVRSESAKDFGARNHVMGGQNYKNPDFTRWVRGMLE
jgi:hypothetical protein